MRNGSKARGLAESAGVLEGGEHTEPIICRWKLLSGYLMVENGINAAVPRTVTRAPARENLYTNARAGRCQPWRSPLRIPVMGFDVGGNPRKNCSGVLKKRLASPARENLYTNTRRDDRKLGLARLCSAP